MKRRALLVGIDQYEWMPSLQGCVADTLALQQVLQYHDNYDPNYDCHVLISPGLQRISERLLREELQTLFAFDEGVLFYFSGHGYATPDGIYLTTSDGTHIIPGIPMNEVLQMANISSAREVVIILDCCYSGGLGEIVQNEREVSYGLPFRDGITLLASSRSSQLAIEVDGHGMFTRLVIGALKGGAKDTRGRVSAASIYAYVEQALGPWDQRPVYKSNASQVSPIRFCQPDVSDEELRRLPQFFPALEHQYPLDPTYEVTRPEALPEHVSIFHIFERYRNARLLRPSYDEALYFAAIRSHPVELTPLGQFYRQLAENNLLEGNPTFIPPRSFPMPDAESVAQLFHETYEKFAPAFDYETREATRVPWEQVPERNKHLMVAVAAEVIAVLFPPPDTSKELPNGIGE